MSSKQQIFNKKAQSDKKVFSDIGAYGIDT